MIESIKTIFDIASPIFILLLCVIAWFIKKDINSFGDRLDKHDEMLVGLVADVSKLIGRQDQQDIWNGRNRRNHLT